MSYVDLLRAPKRPTALSGRWPLDMPLVQFSPLAEDAWTLEDAFQGTVIFGSTGSGKTSGSGQLLALKFLKAGFGGLVLCVDIEEANLWRSYLKAAGREKDGLFSQLIHRCALISWITKRQKAVSISSRIL
jgi:hypothetical protein